MNPSNTPDASTAGDPTTSRRLHRALIEVEHEGQLDELAELAGGADIGLTVLGTEDGEHLDFVNVVDVDEREDGLYVFAERADADRFADAVDHRCGGEETVEFHRAFLVETPVNLGAAAERLIASERGDALEDVFGPALAEDVREGLALDAALGRVEEVGESDSDAARLLRRWIQLDAPSGPPEEGPAAGAPGSLPLRGYTVVGCRGRGGAPYVTTVHTADGPEVALDLAHDDFEEDRGLEVVAIFHGGPEFVDFDAPEGDVEGGGSR